MAVFVLLVNRDSILSNPTLLYSIHSWCCVLLESARLSSDEKRFVPWCSIQDSTIEHREYIEMPSNYRLTATLCMSRCLNIWINDAKLVGQITFRQLLKGQRQSERERGEVAAGSGGWQEVAIEGGKGKGGGLPHFLKKLKINKHWSNYVFFLFVAKVGNKNVFLNIHAEEIRLSFFLNFLKVERPFIWSFGSVVEQNFEGAAGGLATLKCNCVPMLVIGFGNSVRVERRATKVSSLVFLFFPFFPPWDLGCLCILLFFLSFHVIF